MSALTHVPRRKPLPLKRREAGAAGAKPPLHKGEALKKKPPHPNSSKSPPYDEGLFKRFSGWLGMLIFSSLTRRIIFLNLVAIVIFVSGILFLNQFREGLIDARVESLLTQGEIIAGAIAASATVETNAITIDPERLLELRAGESIGPSILGEDNLDFPINPERVAPLLRRLIEPTRTRARIYDQDGLMLLDSRALYSSGQILRFKLPPVKEEVALYEKLWQNLSLWLRRSDLPIYRELDGTTNEQYPEVLQAFEGNSASIVRITEKGELIVSVAVPVQRFRAVLGVLLLSTQGRDIDAIVEAERLAIIRVFLVAVGVTLVLSILLASTIAGPMHKLAAAAERVRQSVKTRGEIPDFSGRRDEIGYLSRALREMTDALFNRIAAIERFAADVAHELKNPLTSLRSAVETLPLAKDEQSRQRLLSVILHDIRRLDRLISDISDASRLDAELARQDAAPVDLARLLFTVAAIARETAPPDSAKIELELDPKTQNRLTVLGHDSRLAQVINNLIDNARSFSPPGGSVRIRAARKKGKVQITVEDDGPGVRPEVQQRIFERFYTDRPSHEAFGQNSGLGLSISRQIIEAHGGEITVQNWSRSDEKAPAGARFIVYLPAMD